MICDDTNMNCSCEMQIPNDPSSSLCRRCVSLPLPQLSQTPCRRRRPCRLDRSSKNFGYSCNDSRWSLSWLLLLLFLFGHMATTVGAANPEYNFAADFGGIPNDRSFEACQHNSRLLSHVLQHNASNAVIVFPQELTFHFHHGIYAAHVQNTVLMMNGILRFERHDFLSAGGIDENKRPFPACFMLDRSNNITITSNNTHVSKSDPDRHPDNPDVRGVVDGRGPQYWGIPMLGYLQLEEHRPRLMRFNQTSNMIIENIILQDSPYHTLYLDSCNNVTVRHVSIVARRTPRDGHGWIDLSAFNTDGMDVSGDNIHVHDCDIWVQDDCIAVKDSFHDTGHGYKSTNMVFERINATGLGFVIGSIGGNTIRNITFRNSYLHRPVKAIYMKFTGPSPFWLDLLAQNLTEHPLIEEVVYENITVEGVTQWGIWMGPAQQADTINPCHANPCSLCWPQMAWLPGNGVGAQCHVVDNTTFRNITLRNILLNNLQYSPGVFYGSAEQPMYDITLDHVQVTAGELLPLAMAPLKETFPGLWRPIHDPYIPKHLLPEHWFPQQKRHKQHHQRKSWLPWNWFQPRRENVQEEDGKDSLNRQAEEPHLGTARTSLPRLDATDYDRVANEWYQVHGQAHYETLFQEAADTKDTSNKNPADVYPWPSSMGQPATDMHYYPPRHLVALIFLLLVFIHFKSSLSKFFLHACQSSRRHDDDDDESDNDDIQTSQEEQERLELEHETSNLATPLLSNDRLPEGIPRSLDHPEDETTNHAQDGSSSDDDRCPHLESTSPAADGNHHNSASNGANQAGEDDSTDNTERLGVIGTLLPNKEEEEGEENRMKYYRRMSQHCFYATVTLLVLSYLVFPTVTARYIFAYWYKPRWERTNAYFECRGVIRGIAKGNTWPVPSCFTVIEEEADNNNDTHLINPTILAATANNHGSEFSDS